MPNLGTDLANASLNAWFRNAAFTTLTAQMAVSLHSGDPGTSGALEIGGSSYARQNVTFGIPAGNAVAASASVIFTGMPACIGASAVWGCGVWCGSQFVTASGLVGGAQAIAQGSAFPLVSLACSLS